MRHWKRRDYWGFSLIELMVVVAIMGTLAAIAIPVYSGFIEKAKTTKAIAEISHLQAEIILFRVDNGLLPDTLADIGRGNLMDPWGNPYQYLNFDNVQGEGKKRKDKMLVPINLDFDLYSMGPDGKSTQPLTAKASRDDIIRANNGSYIGKASEYF